jgi:hypothetical protein
MNLNTKNLKLFRREDKTYNVHLTKKSDSSDLDITGATIQFSIKKTVDDADYQIHKDLGPATKASISILASNSQLDYAFKTTGVEGNDVSIEYVDPSANNSPLSVSVVETVITRNSQVVTNKNIRVSLATDGTGAITTVANSIKTAIEADTTANTLVDITVPGTGANIVTAVSQTYLIGGLSGGITITTASEGRFEILISSDETFSVVEGDYVYDILIVLASKRTVAIKSKIQFLTAVTE